MAGELRPVVTLHPDFSNAASSIGHLKLITIDDAVGTVSKHYPGFFNTENVSPPLKLPKMPKFSPELKKDITNYIEKDTSIRGGCILYDYHAAYASGFANLEETFEKNPQSSINCVYVDVHSCKLILFVTAQIRDKMKSGTPNSEQAIAEKVISQLELIEKLFDLSKIIHSFVEVRLLVEFSKPGASEKTAEEAAERIRVHVTNGLKKWANNQICFSFAYKPSKNKPFGLTVLFSKEDKFSDSRDPVKIKIDFDQIVACMILTCPKIFRFFVNPTSIPSVNGTSFSPANVDEVITSIFGLYFPEFGEKLETLPSLDVAPISLLDKENPGSVLQSNDDGTRKFLAELRDFWMKFLRSYQLSHGVLLYTVDQKTIGKIFTRVNKNDSFECDWLWCTAKGFISFELGLTSSPQEPKSAIANKLKQITLTTAPKLQLIVLSLWIHFHKSRTPGLEISEEFLQKGYHFIRRYVKFVIYITNTNKVAVDNFLAGFVPKKEEISYEFLPQVYFLLKEKSLKSEELRLYGISKKENFLSLGNAELSIDALFPSEEENSSSSYGSAEYGPFLETAKTSGEDCVNETIQVLRYISAMMIIGNFQEQSESAFLSISQRINPEKYQKAAGNLDENLLTQWMKLDILPSIQQYRLLERDLRFVHIYGEPGTGKTTLLQIVAFQEAMKSNIDKVYFAVPESKYWLIRQLKQFVQKSDCDFFAQKFELIDLEKSCREDKWSTVTWRHLHRSVLLVDEVRFESPQMSKLMFSFKCQKKSCFYVINAKSGIIFKDYCGAHVIAGKGGFGKSNSLRYLKFFDFENQV